MFDHIEEYQLDIVALTETWLSSEDSKNKHVIDQCVAHGYTLPHSPRHVKRVALAPDEETNQF